MVKKILLSTLAITAIACSNDNPDSIGGGGNSGAGSNGGGGVVFSTTPTGGSGAGGMGGLNDPGKAGELKLIVRDFKFWDGSTTTSNPDFENVPATSANQYGPWPDPDIVTDALDDNHLPVYKSADKTVTTHGKKAFDQWFRNTEGMNYMQLIPVTLTKNGQGLFEYDSSKPGPLNKDGMFFPIDDGTDYKTPFGNQGGKDAGGRSHNFSFTVEMHTVFTYAGGEHFYFRGDDDVFVYINNKLVINLGGIHGTEEKDVDLDAMKSTLGLSVGNTYNLDFFYAERHMVASDLLITTGLELTNNGDIPIL
jgi:fibro-slime domain-containing protein